MLFPILREFWKLYDVLSTYKEEGIGANLGKYHELLKNGKVKSARDGIQEEVEKAREVIGKVNEKELEKKINLKKKFLKNWKA